MTDYAHPLQVLTDLMTVRERKGTLAGLKAGLVGDGYNMANSVIVGCLAVGMTVTIACPKGYRPAADVLMLAKQYGDKFTLTKFSTRRRTASTWKRPCWRCCWRENKSITVRGTAGERERANLPFFVEAMGKREAMARLRAGHARPLRTVEKWDVGRPAPRPPCPFATRRSLAEHCRGRRPRRPAEGSRPLPTMQKIKGQQWQGRGPGMPGPYGDCFRPLDAMWYTGYITVKRYTMPKQTLQQKIRRALGRFTAKRIAMILLGTAILSFGIHNIHQRTAITEGGIIGLVLLINHWLGVPASVASPLLDAASYALAFKFLGWDFLLSAGLASVSLAGFYRIWECLPPMLPDLTPWPLAAALLGGVFVGVGVGLIVRQGGSSGGDDALALVIHKLTGWRLSRAYLFTDLTVLFASLSYIPFRRIAFSLVTVTVSSLLIDYIQGNTA